MKNPIPCHRRQQQPNKPSQIQEKGVILGLGMLTRLWLPVCRAVPARRARDVGIRHVADDGGGPPSAGLLPAGHRSTAVAPPPGSDPRPPAGTQRTPSTPATPPTYSNFNAADSSEHPSARRPRVPEHTLPPHCRRRPEQQQQQKKPKRSDLFGSASAILQLGMKTAVPHLRPPPCRGGGPPSAGLLPAGHRSTPAAPPPVGLLSTFDGSDLRPPAGTPPTPSTPATQPTYSNFNAAGRSEPPSARRPGVPEDTLPPHQRRRPEQQQQKPKRSDLFASASAMLRLGMKTAVPHLRPPACRTVPLLTGGGPPSASLLPAGHGLTPATPPVSPSVGLLFNFHGPCPRLPAGPGTPWTGRHLLAPHCPVIRIRRHLQLNMMVSSIL